MCVPWPDQTEVGASISLFRVVQHYEKELPAACTVCCCTWAYNELRYPYTFGHYDRLAGARRGRHSLVQTKCLLQDDTGHGWATVENWGCDYSLWV